MQFGTRTLITNTTVGFNDCGCGGIGYIGVFAAPGAAHAYYQPALVFQRGSGSTAKGIAEIASHEAAHNLGLEHDGTSFDDYFAGHNGWAPVMGDAYNAPLSQFSKGEYGSATTRGRLRGDDGERRAAGGRRRRRHHGHREPAQQRGRSAKASSAARPTSTCSR